MDMEIQSVAKSLCILASKQIRKRGRRVFCVYDKKQILGLSNFSGPQGRRNNQFLVSKAELFLPNVNEITLSDDNDDTEANVRSEVTQLQTDSREVIQVKLNAKPEAKPFIPRYREVSTKKAACEQYAKKEVRMLSGSRASQQSFFPLAVDDYFMTIALLVRMGNTENTACAVVVSRDSLDVMGCSASEGTAQCAEMSALKNAVKYSRADLTKCALYTTGYPCPGCIEALLQAGIQEIVYAGNSENEHSQDTIDIVREKKPFFRKYKCYIQIKNEEKKFLVNLSTKKVYCKKLVKPCPAKTSASTSRRRPSLELETTSYRKPTYDEFFMAMAFLAHARSKDNKYQVGACLVTPHPHRLVSMGYNGMPDGRGFRDIHMDWGDDQTPYICHAELNTVITAFRREADLTKCTLYVTHSPCAECCKLIIQSGIKNVVFARYYNKGIDAYNLLGQLSEMSLKRYEYPKGVKDSAEILLLDLEELSVKLGPSPRKRPQLEDCEVAKGRRNVDFPFDDYFMSLAVLAKSRSPFKKEPLPKVGACIVYQEPRRAVSVGYSGYPDGFDAHAKSELKVICCAEANAILSAFRYHANLTNSILYTTGYPCPSCATKILQSGIKVVVYNKEAKIHSKQDDKDVVDKLFFCGKVAAIEYERKKKNPKIVVDIKGLVVIKNPTAKQLELFDM